MELDRYLTYPSNKREKYDDTDSLASESIYAASVRTKSMDHTTRKDIDDNRSTSSNPFSWIFYNNNTTETSKRKKERRATKLCNYINDTTRSNTRPTVDGRSLGDFFTDDSIKYDMKDIEYQLEEISVMTGSKMKNLEVPIDSNSNDCLQIRYEKPPKLKSIDPLLQGQSQQPDSVNRMITKKYSERTLETTSVADDKWILDYDTLYAASQWHKRGSDRYYNKFGYCLLIVMTIAILSSIVITTRNSSNEAHEPEIISNSNKALDVYPTIAPTMLETIEAPTEVPLNNIETKSSICVDDNKASFKVERHKHDCVWLASHHERPIKFCHSTDYPDIYFACKATCRSCDSNKYDDPNAVLSIDPPVDAPVDIPVPSPVLAPILLPTYSPTPAPTVIPTRSPQTRSPTTSPTEEETYVPTSPKQHIRQEECIDDSYATIYMGGREGTCEQLALRPAYQVMYCQVQFPEIYNVCKATCKNCSMKKSNVVPTAISPTDSPISVVPTKSPTRVQTNIPTISIHDNKDTKDNNNNQCVDDTNVTFILDDDSNTKNCDWLSKCNIATKMIYCQPTFTKIYNACKATCKNC